MNPVRAGLAALVVAVMGIAVLGIGMGDAPASPDPAPKTAEVAAAKQRIAAGGKEVQEGKAEFEADGCDACHAIAASGAKGVLGPRLDVLADDSVQDDVKNILQPRVDIVEGYEKNLMPVHYGSSINSKKDVEAIAAYVKAASGAKKGGKG